jgi:4a-hydroxytetrahydrobiopterin dehydratase
MAVQLSAELVQKKCQPCEGGVAPVSAGEAKAQVEKLPGWTLSADGKTIRKQWTAKDFPTAIEFFNQVARVAESEDHHPDLHLTGYRNVAIELSTHAIGGLSENDFILAAKIDQVPIELKKPKSS